MSLEHLCLEEGSNRSARGRHMIRFVMLALGLAVAAGAAVLGLSEAAAQDGTIEVTTSDDGALGAAGVECPAANGDECTLRAAVAVADDGDTITFATGINPQLSEAFGLRQIDIGGARSITIQGNEDNGQPGTTISGGEPDTDDYGYQLFRIEGGTSVTFRNVELTGGSTEGSGVRGAAIDSLGDLTIIDSVIRDNRATSTGSGGAQGGAIYQSGASLVIEGSLLADNGSVGTNGDGGAIYATQTELRVSETTFTGNSAGRYGGAVLGDGGSTELHVEDVRFVDNSVGAVGIFSGGGAIRLERGAEAVIEGSHFDGNSTDLDTAGGRHGGAINVNGFGAGVTVRGSTFEDNAARTSGGAIFATGGTIDVATSTFEGNLAALGGAVSGYAGASVTIERSLFRGNEAEQGGGVYLNGEVALDLSNSTLSGNSADEGAGIWAAGTQNDTVITHTTIVNNMGEGVFQEGDAIPTIIGRDPMPGSSTMTFSHSIIAGNSGDDCGFTPLDLEGGGASPLASDGYNLDTDGTCAIDPTDLTVDDVMLGDLADNGGPTLTHLPLEGSPAIDGGLNPTCVVDGDQRGEPRPGTNSSACDIGAVEVQLPGEEPPSEEEPSEEEADDADDEAEELPQTGPAEPVVSDPDFTG